MKKALSLLLSFILIVACFTSIPMNASAAVSNLSDFNAMVNSFKANRYSHGSTYVNDPGRTGGIECFGFANEIAKYIFGSYPTTSMSAKSVNANWTVAYGGSAVDYLSVGDIVRYEYHSIFITGISGDTVYYCQANAPGGTNLVTYDNTMSIGTLKSKVSKTLSHTGATTKGWVAHCKNNLASSGYTCGCSTSYAGVYSCTADGGLNLRSGHGTGYSSIGSIPKGATVQVTKANGSWAHVTYNGLSGYASMSYLYKVVDKEYSVNIWASEKGDDYGPDQCPEATQGIVENRYYIWYKIFDKFSGELCDGVDTYNAEISVYSPDGSLFSRYSYDNCPANWIWIEPQVAGLYKMSIRITGDITISSDRYFNVSYGGNVSFDKSSMLLTMPTKATDKLTITLSGKWPENAAFYFEYNGNYITHTRNANVVTITAKATGNTPFKIIIIDKGNNNRVIATALCNISVQSNYTGWADKNGKKVYYEKGKLLTNRWINYKGTWYYVDANGYRKTDCWQQGSKGLCYLTKQGYMATNCWVNYKGTWYYVDAYGYRVTNKWVKGAEGWCWLTKNGYMATNGWIKDTKGWCYINDKGYAVSGCWKKGAEGWCWLGKDNYMVTNKWVKDTKGWCYINDKGYAVSNCWKKGAEGWCWLGKDNYMVTNSWVKDSKGWCYVDAKGYAVSNCWKKASKGWCWIGKDNYMVTNSWVKDTKSWAFVDKNGHAVSNCWKKNANGWFYIGKDNYIVTNTSLRIGGKVYKFNKAGVCTNR